MHIPFDQLSDDSRIWIFQAGRALTEQELVQVKKQLQNFTSEWAAHGNPLNSSYKIFNNIHLVVGVDLNYNEASGCSIDTLVKTIRNIGDVFDIDFFDRRAVAIQENDEVEVLNFDEVKSGIERGTFTSDTLIYNNVITSKGQLESDWLIKAEDSWLKKYFSKTSATT